MCTGVVLREIEKCSIRAKGLIWHTSQVLFVHIETETGTLSGQSYFGPIKVGLHCLCEYRKCPIF